MMNDFNTKIESKNVKAQNFKLKLKNRFIVDGSSLLGNRLEYSNFFEKDTTVSNDFTIIKIFFERATLREASSFKDFLDKTIAEENNNIIIDLNECEFVDSSFLGTLVAGVKRMTLMNKKFYLIYDSTNRLPIFTATGLDKIFKVFPSVEEAVAA